MMTVEQLMDSIIQLAMQGRLVEQRPEEGTGEDLYKQIQNEKKIQTKIGKKTNLITDEDAPFEIPDTWKWSRLGEIIKFRMGKTPPRSESDYWGNDIPWFSIADMIDGETVTETKEKVSKKAFDDRFNGQISQKGTLVMSFKLTVGKVSILGVDAVHNEAIISIFPIINSDFIMRDYLKTMLPFLSVYGESKKAIKGFTLNSTSLNNIPVPLPPLAEQKRIVAKIEELIPFVKQYATASTKLNTLNATFPEMMKKSILQEAVQGKLVPQDPNDEPASVLLEKIAKEKKRLIKEGKIKKQKKLPEITEDEIPFDIPENWMWTRMGDIVCLENGDRSSKYPKTSDYVESGVPFFGAKDMIEGILSFDNTRFITQKKYDELGNGKLQNGDLVCLLRGSVGKTVEFCANDLYKTGFICAQMVIIRLYDLCLLPYAKIVLESPYYKSALEAKITGTAVKQLPASEIFNMLIPIPPINEQCRICDRVKELMKIMESLRSRQ